MSQPAEKARRPEAVRFAAAVKALEEGKVANKVEAARYAEMNYSTFKHRMQERRTVAQAARAQQKLTPEEETMVLWRCEILKRMGFPPGVVLVHKL